jgi:hypothetical protein
MGKYSGVRCGFSPSSSQREAQQIQGPPGSPGATTTIDGRQIPPPPQLRFIDFRNDFVLYYFVLLIFCTGFLIIYRTIHSPFGQGLKAIRELIWLRCEANQANGDPYDEPS